MMKVYYETHSEPDDLGRQEFTLYWWSRIGNTLTKHGWKGQVFFAVLQNHLAKWKLKGAEIIKGIPQ